MRPVSALLERLSLSVVALAFGVACHSGDRARAGDAGQAMSGRVDAATGDQPEPDGGLSDGGYGEGGTGVEDGGVIPEPTLSELVETVFLTSCVLGRCHVTAAPAGDFSLTGRRIGIYESLLSPASQVAGQNRVTPFDPDGSYLMQKLTAETPAVGTPMPPMGPLPLYYIERIRRWIELGALND